MDYFTEIIQQFITQQHKVLFMGKGVFSYVNFFLNQGVETYGCKESVDHLYVYKNKLIDIHFPTDYFDIIIYKDDDKFTVQIAKEIFRILKQIDKNGRFIFEAQKKNNDFIEKILTEVTFAIEGIIPINNTKTIFQTRKMIQQRIKILLPPGIGDVYWSLVKMQSFLKQRNMNNPPDIYVYDYIDERYNSHNRALPFIEMFPFVNVKWKVMDLNSINPIMINWNDMFIKTEKTIATNILGCDYLMIYNGYINTGKSLEEADPELQCNWFPPMFKSLYQRTYQKVAKEKYGKYAIIHFKFRGTYQKWNKFFPVEEVIKFINKITDALKITLIYVGSLWDMNDIFLQKILREIHCINLIGKTTLEEVFGLIQESEFVIGYPSGITMFSPVLGKKTLLIWSDLYPEATSWNVVPPATRGKNYFVEQMNQAISANQLLHTLMRIIS